MLLVAALAVGYAALLVGVMALGRAAAIGDRAREEASVTWVEFHGGGPKDGDREQIEAGRSEWLCLGARVLSPWGRDDREEDERLVVTGRYVRTPRGMAWRAEA